ncbi:hypothetical protein CHS0354_035561 [Potamilus streckersoni]|uniref:Uncharacterized protein n=1 Tax=Potamilus streckersoni TaxID=2493646 RepID=A0AAE0RST0_9BIVA|nr:hypothetical protein CHS0354_035561 [Potamilus streckersoni]
MVDGSVLVAGVCFCTSCNCTRERQYLYLTCNQPNEDEIQDCFEKNKDAINVSVTNSSLTRVPPSISSLQRLLDIGLIWLPMLFNYTVNVSGNAISNFTNHKGIRVSDFKSKTSFRVDLQRNNLTTIDVNYLLRLGKAEHIWDIYNTGIGGIDILYNPVVCDCLLYPFTVYLNAFRFMDDLNRVYIMRCAKPLGLSTTPIAEVSIHDFNCSVEDCPPLCQCTRTIALDLITLVCVNDTLDTIPFELPNGKFINLSVHSRNVRELSDRTYFRNVTNLDLSFSSISTIHADFLPNFERLGTIQIYNNSLTTLPEEIQNMNLENISSL